ncbi:MAG: beta-galactosidase [Chloroflexi bacterium]|nr:beta-galactosidase [Chloroflexota bacterium]
MPNTNLPAFPYGAVYFRKSNPPRDDWDRDYRTASEDGMNIFRHWFLWSAIEIAPGQYDWEEYDEQLDLAALNGIKTIIAEFIFAAPEWAFVEYAHARFIDEKGLPLNSQMGGSSATGGYRGLCLDNDDWRAYAEGFLRTLAARYKGHRGLGGYDIWNESNNNPNFCYCPATLRVFQGWLKAKYGDLKTLGRAWGRHSFATWENVTPPRAHGPYADTLDWIEFRGDRAHELMRWRRDVIRGVDPDCAMTAHGLATTLSAMPASSADDWRAAAEVESYGVTWGSSRHGDEPWKQMQAFDLIRAASRGKPFWHAEAYGGPLWLAAQVRGKPRNEGRIASTDDIRYWSFVSFMAGATGLMYLRWRPLLNGVLFGAFGPYGMDGSRTERSEMVRQVGAWATAAEQARLWESRPVQGDIGIVYVPEAERFTFAQTHGTGGVTPGVWTTPTAYTHAMQGAYRAFWTSNIQADWVHIDDIDQYRRLYLPMPIMLNRQTAARLRDWVAAGGTLISEGCPAYWGDLGWVGAEQPNLGLDELFGAKESYVEFTPDLLADLRLTVRGESISGGVFLQAYTPSSGVAVGHYEDGQVAAVEHTFGNGKTLLLGTMAGAGFFAHADDAGSARFFAGLLGGQQAVTSSDARIKARLHAGSGGLYLWVANPTREPVSVSLSIRDSVGEFASARTLWGAAAAVDGRAVSLTAPARDVTVLELTS